MNFLIDDSFLGTDFSNLSKPFLFGKIWFDVKMAKLIIVSIGIWRGESKGWNQDLHLTHPFMKHPNIFHILRQKLKNSTHHSQTNKKVFKKSKMDWDEMEKENI